MHNANKKDFKVDLEVKAYRATNNMIEFDSSDSD